jgi:hypothetical protein
VNLRNDKQCDGIHPQCANCAKSGSKCAYETRLPPPTIRRKRHVRALEARIALLESYLAKHGLPEVGTDIIDWDDDGETSSIVVQTDANDGGSPAGHEHKDSSRIATVSDLDLDVELSPRSCSRSLSLSGISPSNTRALPTPGSDWDFKIDPLLQGDGINSPTETAASGTESCSMVGVLRELSLAASGGYMGASSSIALGRMVNAITRRRHSTDSGYGTPDSTPDDKNSDMDHSIIVAVEPTDRLVHGYIKYVAYRLPVLFTPAIWQNHSRRFQKKRTAYQKATLNLVYALGAQSLETVRKAGGRDTVSEAEGYYNEATKQLENVLGLNDMRSVTVLLLLALYCLGNPRGPGAW